MDLLSQLVSEKQAKIIKDLYSDDLSDEAKVSIKDFIAQKLIDSPSPIFGNSLNQVVLITSQARFCGDEESVSVAVILFYCLNRVDILPKVTEHRGLELGSRCLVSTSLFKPALERLYYRYGAPSPNFYVEVGKSTLKDCQLEEVADNFELWSQYIGEKFTPAP